MPAFGTTTVTTTQLNPMRGVFYLDNGTKLADKAAITALINRTVPTGKYVKLVMSIHGEVFDGPMPGGLQDKLDV